MAKKRAKMAGPDLLGKRWWTSYRAPSPTISPTGPGKRLGSPLCSVFPGQSQPAQLNHSHSFRSGEKITVTPSSKELLFYPPSMEATVSGGTCLLHERLSCLCFSDKGIFNTRAHLDFHKHNIHTGNLPIPVN